MMEFNFTSVNVSMDTNSSSEDIPTRVIHNVGATLISPIGFFANMIVIFAILKARLYRQNVILFVLNLVINNALVCSTSLPYIAAMSFTVVSQADVNMDGCRFMGYLTYSIISSELLGLNLIAINRYFLIVRYSTYLEIYSRKSHIAWMIAISWVIYPLIFIFPVTNVWGSLSYDPYRFLCHPFTINNSFGKFYAGFAFLTSVPLLFFGYISILPKVFAARRKISSIRSRSVSSPEQESKQNRKDHQLVILVLLLLTTFCVLYLPLATISVMDPTTSKYDPRIHSSLVYLAWSHCIVNPVLYAVMNVQIREAMLSLFSVSGYKKDKTTNVATLQSHTRNLSISNDL